MADSHREEIAKLETLYANNPEGRVFTHLAEAYRKAGELERAREILEDGLRRHNDYSSAHVVLGRVLTDQGDPDGAAGAFRRVLELDRHNLVALRSLGEISAGAGRTDEALHYYRELLSLDPSDEVLRGTVRGLEERRAEPPQEAFAPAAPAYAEVPAEPEPAGEPLPEPSGEPPAFAAGEPVPGEPARAPFEPFQAESEPAPPEFAAGPAVPFFPDAAVEPADEEGPPSTEPAAGAVSENWEEDVGIELEPMPGDLAALADDTPGFDRVEGLETSAAEDAWAVTSEWLAQPPIDPLASGLDLGIEGEELGRVELPASDLELTEPPGDDLTPFDTPSGRLDLASEEPGDSTPFDVLDTADAADVPPEAVFGATGRAEGLEIDVGPATAEFGGPAAPAGFETWQDAEPEDEAGELVTETMAELYFAQGAYGRAADVYRSLLADRPDDARLQERLADAESRAEAPFGGEEEERGEGWLEGVESAWTGGGGVAGAETTPYAWAEPSADEAPAGPRVGEYFRALLTWRPEGAAGQAVVEPAAETAPAGAEHLAYEAAETEAPAYLPIEALEERHGEVDATSAEPWDEPVVAPELPEAASVAGAEEDGTDDDEDLEMFRSWLQSLRK
jgi:tetratricopeptide (TPR) repeat protein